MRYEIVPATPLHLNDLAATMRPEDAAECEASHGLTRERLLQLCVSSSYASLTLLIGGRVAAVCGIQDVAGQSAAVAWALTSTVVDRYPFAAASASRRIVGGMLEVRPALFNYVDARYAKAVRWLKWLGFTVEYPAVPYGARGRPFHLAHISKEAFRARCNGEGAQAQGRIAGPRREAAQAEGRVGG